MLLAKARGELVEKRLVELQASFLLLAMSRQALALPQALCDRLAAVNGPLEVKAILNEAMLGLLAEMQELPNRIESMRRSGRSSSPRKKPAAPQAEVIGPPPARMRRTPKGRPRQPGPQCKPDVRRIPRPVPVVFCGSRMSVAKNPAGSRQGHALPPCGRANEVTRRTFQCRRRRAIPENNYLRRFRAPAASP